MTADQIVTIAINLLGVKYVWGGSTPQTGLDCSGLLFQIQKQAGVTAGRLTASGYSKIGKLIEIGKQKAGDFLFFGNPVTHCAVYVGNGYMIESKGGRSNTASNPGVGVSKTLVSHRKDLTVVRRVWDETVPTYLVGQNYETVVDHLHVRYSPWGQIKSYSELTIDGMKHAYSDGCLKKGTVVTVKKISIREESTWLQIPSGWICAIPKNGEIYVK